LPDNDKAGTEHLNIVARQLHGTAVSIRILKLPDLPAKGDVVDWAANGGTREQLDQLIATNAEKWELPDATGSPEYSDDNLARQFAERHKNSLRYVKDWNRWLEWDGSHWVEDRTVHTFEKARSLCREVAATANSKTALTLTSAKKRADVENMARGDRRLAAIVGQWDSDLMLQNTPLGISNMSTTQSYILQPHRHDAYMTKITMVGPDPSCKIDLWEAFLDKVTNGDAELVAYLQRVCGYCCTGSTNEHAMFFLYGTGANGKSVFINTVSQILGDYHKPAHLETFVVTMGDRHPTDLAMLRGARLVTVNEIEEGRRWAEAKIKSMTGGDTISARFMHQDFFQYQPQFKLMVAGNHKPSLRSVDEAIKRRMNLIPFTVTIPPDKCDLQLTEKLRAERPGILHWMLEGCAAWQRGGVSTHQRSCARLLRRICRTKMRTAIGSMMSLNFERRLSDNRSALRLILRMV
jgi:putative DNA primase/helicase